MVKMEFVNRSTKINVISLIFLHRSPQIFSRSNVEFTRTQTNMFVVCMVVYQRKCLKATYLSYNEVKVQKVKYSRRSKVQEVTRKHHTTLMIVI